MKVSTQSGPLIASDEAKAHFEVLDGLRGTAALLVVAFHLQGITVLFDAQRLLLPHAYLAVDFFFALSGFVVGYAYDDRWSTMTTRQFLTRRLIRLHPLVLLGAAFAAALLALPSAPLPNRLGDNHPLNAPAWTLLQEYIGNLVYALVLRRPKTRWLARATVAAGLASVTTAMSLGSYDTGWGLHNFWGAPVRLAYPFLTGLLLFRLHHRLARWRVGFVPLRVILLMALALPALPTDGVLKLNGLYQAFCVITLFPAIIVVGRHSHGGPTMTHLCQTVGQTSYPLYITHYPFVHLYMNWIATGDGRDAVTGPVAMGLYVFTVVFAVAAYRIWGRPLRLALRRWIKPAEAAGSS